MNRLEQLESNLKVQKQISKLLVEVLSDIVYESCNIKTDCNCNEQEECNEEEETWTLDLPMDIAAWIDSHAEHDYRTIRILMQIDRSKTDLHQK
ncbi:MAG: hypothetical protein EHM34_03460 [Nitrosopumilales archaeon]|nr:MAG: hypothetical protein EHM34_08820 [Nitrosopumilales archaeon]RPI84523.1 MAG: hypothetical protein EHM34_03460 [Nitrosopumilales archaeon]